MTSTATRFLSRGVVMPDAASVWIEDAVPDAAIAPGAVLHPGCRIRGAATVVGPGCVLGEEGPVTLVDCQLEAEVRLQGGSFAGATFLAGASFGSCGHVRPGTLVEEQASAAHCVGLKQTLLMPFVTLGSLINFCDCLMAGGTDRRNHSEVGSSYVHFNYTPHRDKATPSLIGDVPRGVMLDQAPIFLGGQGGLAGPVRIEYGTVVAAGTVCRRDVETGGRLVFNAPPPGGDMPYDSHRYGDIRRALRNNLLYVGNLCALYQWYRHARARFAGASAARAAAYAGAERRIEEMVAERLHRLDELADNVRASLARGAGTHAPVPRPEAIAAQAAFVRQWPEVRPRISAGAGADRGAAARAAFLAALDAARQGDRYLATLAALPAEARRNGTAWLQAVVDSVSRELPQPEGV